MNMLPVNLVFGVAMAALVVLFAYSMTGCPAHQEPPPVASATASALQPEVEATECELACKNLETLGCPEVDTLDGGEPCVEVCRSGEAGGISLKPACVAAAKDVEAVRACGTVRCVQTKGGL